MSQFDKDNSMIGQLSNLKMKNIGNIWKFVIILNSAFFNLNSAFSQDIHFSQYYACPLVLNPATTGVFDGDVRLSGSYKDQWRSISKPFKTIFASLDGSLFKSSLRNGSLGLGLTAFSDKAGTSKMGTSQLNISIAYTTFINEFNSISLGLQGGAAQKSVDYSELKWDNQFDGQAYNPVQMPGEVGESNFYYLDAGFGILWNLKLSENFRIVNGMGLSHINKPQHSFYAGDVLKTKLTVHGSAQQHFKGTRWSLFPSWMILKQGNLNEFNIGGFLGYRLNYFKNLDNKNSLFYFGCFYRWDDAIIPTIRLELFNNLAAILSYDITTSDLGSTSQYQGGLEISLICTTRFKKQSNLLRCPAWVN